MPPPRSRSYGSGGTPNWAQAPPSYGRTSSAQVQVTITWNTSYEAYDVSVPFQPNFVEFIKAKIPGSDRDWRPQSKIWVVKEAWLGLLQTLATELWGASSVTVTSRQMVEDAERQQREALRVAVLASLPDRERAIFELIELCPNDALKAMYRKAAQELHPDRQGGDAEKMTRLNAAWTNVEKFLG